MRSNPQLPLVPFEADPEKMIKKGKSSQKCFFATATSASGQLPDSTLDTLLLYQVSFLYLPLKYLINLILKSFLSNTPHLKLI
jgi:hypothetical protein